MLMQPDKTIPLSLITLVGFNLIPISGVFAWGWQSFDLIFLYWMENIVIGVFTLGRMVIRPYGHPVELAFPLFFAPFFALALWRFQLGTRFVHRLAVWARSLEQLRPTAYRI